MSVYSVNKSIVIIKIPIYRLSKLFSQEMGSVVPAVHRFRLLTPDGGCQLLPPLLDGGADLQCRVSHTLSFPYQLFSVFQQSHNFWLLYVCTCMEKSTTGLTVSKREKRLKSLEVEKSPI